MQARFAAWFPMAPASPPWLDTICHYIHAPACEVVIMQVPTSRGATKAGLYMYVVPRCSPPDTCTHHDSSRQCPMDCWSWAFGQAVLVLAAASYDQA